MKIQKIIFICFLSTLFAFQLRGQVVNAKKLGVKGNGIEDDTKALQKIIDGNATSIFLPKGTYLISKCKLRSNLKIYGEKGTIIKSLDIVANDNLNGTFELKTGKNESYKNISISDITFIGSPPYTHNTYPQSFYFLAIGNSIIQNLSFKNLTFKGLSNNAILLLANQSKLGFEKVVIDNCKGYGSPDAKKFLVGNLVRVMNNSDRQTNYGIVIAKDITVQNCYAQYIRTLADIKRGCSNVLIQNNVTKNMHDCHFSIDGSFYCKVLNNKSSMDVDFLNNYALTGSNIIEIQGEHIDVIGNSGGNQKNQGIFVTDYAYPEENHIGHISRYINISKNKINGIKNTGIKILNAEDVSIENNTITNCSHWDIVVDSQTGEMAADRKTKLAANRITISNNITSGKGIIDNVNKTRYKSNLEIIKIQKN